MGDIKRLSECEELVMSIIWSLEEEPDLAAVMKRVNSRYSKEWKSQTVSTFLCRLVKKEYLKSYRKGRYTYYIPLIRRENYCESQIKNMAMMFFEGDESKLEDFLKELRMKKN